MGFQFRYESLLNYRRHLKDMAQVELARSLEQLALAKEALGELTHEYSKVSTTLHKNLQQRVQAHELRNYADYLARLKQDITQKALEVAEWEDVVEQKRKRLLEKDKDWKIIDKLKDKDFQRWQTDRRSKEQKALEEMAILRHGRRFV